MIWSAILLPFSPRSTYTLQAMPWFLHVAFQGYRRNRKPLTLSQVWGQIFLSSDALHCHQLVQKDKIVINFLTLESRVRSRDIGVTVRLGDFSFVIWHKVCMFNLWSSWCHQLIEWGTYDLLGCSNECMPFISAFRPENTTSYIVGCRMWISTSDAALYYQREKNAFCHLQRYWAFLGASKRIDGIVCYYAA